jgi:hypothetical protein
MNRQKNSLHSVRGAPERARRSLYEFVGNCRGEAPEEASVERIAATNIEQGFAYLKRWRPEFEVVSFRRVGLITLLLGSPLD